MTGHIANTDGPLRRVKEAQRRLEWWKKEKERRESARKDTTTASNAEHAEIAEDGAHQVNGNIKS